MRINFGKYVFKVSISISTAKHTLAMDILKEAGGYTGKIQLIKAARHLNPALGLKEAKDLVDNLYAWNAGYAIDIRKDLDK